MKTYGKELIIDLHHCNNELFNRKDLKRFFQELTEALDMEACKLSFWDYHYYPKWFIKLMKWDQEDKIFGTSAIQFIRTSNITIHTIDNLRLVYLNIFSCKDFDEDQILDFAICYFGGVAVNHKTIERK